jgi:hypothetical protein
MKQRAPLPTMTASVSLEDLEHALFWVSSPPEFDAAAFVSRTTGKLFLRGADGPVDDDFPEDIDDGLEYIAVPHRNELGLGRQLVHRFVEDAAPYLRHHVQEVFRRRGAYARFKALLDDNSLLDAWHDYESAATHEALIQWAGEHALPVVRRSAA